MFAIYDIEGRRFRDTLEQLYKIREPFQSPAPKPISDEDEQQKQGQQEQGQQKPSVVSQQAIEAYKTNIQVSDREPVLHAHQLMTSPVLSVDRNASLSFAQTRFESNKIHQMPVLNEKQIITGIITKHRLQKILLDPNLANSGEKTVTDYMSHEVITADPVTDIRRVVKLLLDYHLNAMPIVNDQDQLIGIVSRKDVLRAVINEPPLNLFI